MQMAKVFINKISTVTPPFDIHSKFIEYAPQLIHDLKEKKLFKLMAAKSSIENRYSFLEMSNDKNALDVDGFYNKKRFPGTHERMQLYKKFAFNFARSAIDPLDINDKITHIITTTCTGFYAPGIDLEIIQHYGLNDGVERTAIGFMGCYAAMNALKQAWHIVRSVPDAQVLIVNLELCTLHLQQPESLQELLSFLIFADGCAASIVSADSSGLELEYFNTTLIPDTQDLITWHIGQTGFDMVLSGQVPAIIANKLPQALPKILNEMQTTDISHWAIHPGGRTILDAVDKGASLPDNALDISRHILKTKGNMSSATIMFVLQKMLKQKVKKGCALAFGPGLAIESMIFKSAGINVV